MIKLDVLDNEDAEDQLALFQLGTPLKDLYEECIVPERGRLAAGFIPVGDSRSLSLAISPTITFHGNTSRLTSNHTKRPSKHR